MIPAPVVTRERKDLNTVFFISSDIFSFEPNYNKNKKLSFFSKQEKKIHFLLYNEQNRTNL